MKWVSMTSTFIDGMTCEVKMDRLNFESGLRVYFLFIAVIIEITGTTSCSTPKEYVRCRIDCFDWNAEGGDPGPIRTADLRFRKPMLYPSELRGHFR